MSKITDEERALLTEEEIAGMEEGEDFDEGTPDTEDAATTATADEPVKPGEEAIVINDDGDDDEQQEVPAKPDDTGEPPATAQDEPEQEPAARAPVRRGMALPDDFEQQVEAIGTAKDDLIAKFDEGDVDVREYQKALDDLNRKERELERLKDRVEYDQRTRQDHWVNVDVANFMRDHTEYAGNEVLWDLLDRKVRELQAKSDNEFDPQILSDAHEIIVKALPNAFSNAPAAATDKPKAVPKKTVPSLGSMPAANVDQPGDGKFDWLDRLFETDQVKAEQELAKLSEADQNEYLA